MFKTPLPPPALNNVDVVFKSLQSHAFQRRRRCVQRAINVSVSSGYEATGVGGPVLTLDQADESSDVGSCVGSAG